MASPTGNCALPEKLLRVQPATPPETSQSIWEAFRQPGRRWEQDRRQISLSLEEYPGLGEPSTPTHQEVSSSEPQKESVIGQVDDSGTISRVDAVPNERLSRAVYQHEEDLVHVHPSEIVAEHSSNKQHAQPNLLHPPEDADTVGSEITITQRQQHNMDGMERTPMLDVTACAATHPTRATRTDMHNRQGLHLNEKSRAEEQEQAPMPHHTVSMPGSQQSFPEAEPNQAFISRRFPQERSLHVGYTQSTNTAMPSSMNSEAPLQGFSSMRNFHERERQRMELRVTDERSTWSPALEFGGSNVLDRLVPTPRTEGLVPNNITYGSTLYGHPQTPIRVPFPQNRSASRMYSQGTSLGEAAAPRYYAGAQQEGAISGFTNDGIGRFGDDAAQRQGEGLMGVGIDTYAHRVSSLMPQPETHVQGHYAYPYGLPPSHPGQSVQSRVGMAPTSIGGNFNNQSFDHPMPTSFQPTSNQWWDLPMPNPFQPTNNQWSGLPMPTPYQPMSSQSSLGYMPNPMGLGEPGVWGGFPAPVTSNCPNLPWPTFTPFPTPYGTSNHSSYDHMDYATGPEAFPNNSSVLNGPPLHRGFDISLNPQVAGLGLHMPAIPSLPANDLNLPLPFTSHDHVTRSQYHDHDTTGRLFPNPSQSHLRPPELVQNQLIKRGHRNDERRFTPAIGVEERPKAIPPPKVSVIGSSSVMNNSPIHPPIPQSVNSKMALLVIWPQEAFADDFSEGRISHLRGLIQSANENSIPVFYNTTTMGREIKYSFDSNKFLDDFKSLAIKHHSQSRIIPGLEPHQFGAIVYHTDRVGQFFHGDFPRELWTRGITTLIFTGASAGLPSASFRLRGLGFKNFMIQFPREQQDPFANSMMVKDAFHEPAKAVTIDDWNSNGFWTGSRICKWMANAPDDGGSTALSTSNHRDSWMDDE